jgi:hypothetical protein
MLRRRCREALAQGAPPGLAGWAARYRIPTFERPGPRARLAWSAWIAVALTIGVAVAAPAGAWPLRSALALAAGAAGGWLLLYLSPTLYLVGVLAVAAMLALLASPLLLLGWWVMRARVRQRDRGHPQWGARIEVELSDAGTVTVVGEGAPAVMPWDAVRRVVRFADGLVLVYRAGTLSWLPFSALESASPAALLEFLARVAPPAH